MRMTPIRKSVIGTAVLLVLTAAIGGCSATSNEAGTRVGNPPTVESTTQAFPTNFAVTSPLETATEASTTSLSSALMKTEPSYNTTAFSAATQSISAILNGTTLAACAFDPTKILLQPMDAACYGPAIAYENHPDEGEILMAQPPVSSASPSLPPPQPQSQPPLQPPPQQPPVGLLPPPNPQITPGEEMQEQLPPGDLGLWTENEGDSEQACAAAQLNRRMRGMKFKTQTALEALASMICVANVEGVDLPASGLSQSLLIEMNGMAEANDLDIAFSTANLSHLDSDNNVGSDNDVYEYELDFVYTDEQGDHDIMIRMAHASSGGVDGTPSLGHISYVVSSAGETPVNCPEGITDAGSVIYNRDSSTELRIQSDFANFCGTDVNPIGVDGLISPADKLSASNPDGWSGRYSTFLADFDPTTHAGTYAFAWQAGPNDDATRTFNLVLNESDSGLDGTAFFGFGPDIEETDGRITGFFCNWAGPGGAVGQGEDREMSDYVQRQGLTQTESGPFFTSVPEQLAIGYAPTNLCSYDGDGDFRYDSDGDGTIDTDASEPVENQLLPVTDTDNDGIFDQLEDPEVGFTLPEQPEVL